MTRGEIPQTILEKTETHRTDRSIREDVTLLPFFTTAVCRRPGPDLGAGLTTSGLGAPDFALACEQFDLYVAALEGLGLEMIVLEALEGYPDAHFVEDTAVLTTDMSVITNPGAPARRGERPSIAQVLGSQGQHDRIRAPGTLDGGDVLMIDNHFLIGISDRTNPEGARQLGDILDSFGYTWQTVPVGAGLHFKSSVNQVAENVLLVTDAFADCQELSRYRLIQVPEGEEYAANTLYINGRLIMPTGYPGTRSLLETLDLPIIELNTSEFRKMDGGLTCLSLRI
jgi:dimethylargininase